MRRIATRGLIALACFGGLVFGLGAWLDSDAARAVGGCALLASLFWQAIRNPEIDPLLTDPLGVSSVVDGGEDD